MNNPFYTSGWHFLGHLEGGERIRLDWFYQWCGLMLEATFFFPGDSDCRQQMFKGLEQRRLAKPQTMRWKQRSWEP
jgi:hypothetical protein